jgi:hypothetical protein
MEENVLLEGLRTPKPPEKFQNVCLKTFCGVRATRQLEDFNVLHAGIVLCAGVFIVRAGFRSPFSGLHFYWPRISLQVGPCTSPKYPSNLTTKFGAAIGAPWEEASITPISGIITVQP